MTLGSLSSTTGSLQIMSETTKPQSIVVSGTRTTHEDTLKYAMQELRHRLSMMFMYFSGYNVPHSTCPSPLHVHQSCLRVINRWFSTTYFLQNRSLDILNRREVHIGKIATRVLSQVVKHIAWNNMTLGSLSSTTGSLQLMSETTHKTTTLIANATQNSYQNTMFTLQLVAHHDALCNKFHSVNINCSSHP